ncbi:hypothetical protein L0668_13755 [Paraglaciecola aquimarina]|uniref:Lysozyme inhibitor LprI N-terminal domain-containing protein n=1 Tax=Paraglaciecola algarum TaxID=3050085 RepID=A0ABS9D8Q8_9ALTE|nr:hypothetical protein [Paraglaciecola sp. G1-23]MCF2949180.1 hypothetical protein [Paraglaciecola sp. G1-23]
MKLLILAIITMTYCNLSVAKAQCDTEKQKVDRWNDVLKYKVSERARDKHRAVKQEFLDCLLAKNKPAKKSKKAASSSPSTSTNSSKKHKTHPKSLSKTQTISRYKTKSYKAKNYAKTEHVMVSNYVDFKGKKKQAWNIYFKESAECMENSGDMAVFVKCAKIRKQNLKEFESKWDHQVQQLVP